ncbi:MAG: hypothetical protein FWG03_02535, partial [Clostridiales bacterium]|nr:hypothetical protein [Clostridiales bacterium]
MKKVFAIAMALLLGIAVLAGCGMDGAPPGTEAPEPEPELSPVEEDGSPADSDGVQADSDTAEDENAGQVPGYGSASVYGMEWGIGVGKWDEEAGGATRIAVYQSKGPGTGFNTASFGDKELGIRYIGMKEATGKGSVYFESYESTAGPEYEFVDPASAKGVPSGALFLYDREAWGNLAGRIHYAPGTFGREPADKGQTGDMEQAEGGRRVTESELLGVFSLDGGGDNYLSLMRF